ncbi:MAG: restriction endonuclease subunit S [Phascolarctobacterium sp.]|nr:restriction endonuclease subunit S [Phascolarctobacterium sp.]
MKWEYKTLDELGNVSRGKSKHRPRNDKVLFGGNYPFIQTADVKKADLYITEYQETYNEFGLAQSKLWKEGTLCITIAANIADTAILKIPACFPDSIMGFVPYENVADVKFVKYCFDVLQRDCQNISQGTAQDNLSWEKLSTIKFYVPDYDIQKQIASILSAYDDLIENNKKQIKLLEEAAQRLYKEWFIDLRFPGYEDVEIVDGLSVGWECKKLSELGTVITGKTPSTSNEGFYGNDVPFVKIPDMHNKIFPLNVETYLSEEGANSQKGKYLPPNALLISCIGTVGLINITVEKCQTNQQINALILSNEKILYYMYYYLKGLQGLLQGLGSNGATMTNVNKNKLESILIEIPRYDLIENFFDYCKPVFDKILMLSKENISLQEARDRLLHRLMSGEVEV